MLKISSVEVDDGCMTSMLPTQTPCLKASFSKTVQAVTNLQVTFVVLCSLCVFILCMRSFLLEMFIIGQSNRTQNTKKGSHSLPGYFPDFLGCSKTKKKTVYFNISKNILVLITDINVTYVFKLATTHINQT